MRCAWNGGEKDVGGLGKLGKFGQGKEGILPFLS